MNVCFQIGSLQNGFLISMGMYAQELGYNVSFTVKSNAVKENILRHLPQIRSDKLEVRENFHCGNIHEVIGRAVEIEKKYKEYFSYLVAHDRAIGKGYIFNADNHPDLERSYWSKEKKYNEILAEFLYYEHVYDTFRPDLVIVYGYSKVFAIICRHNGVPYMMCAPPRIGNMYTWVDSEFCHNKKMTEFIKGLCANNSPSPAPEAKFSHGSFCRHFIDIHKNTYQSAIKEVAYQALIETYQLLKGIYKKNSYRYLGWTWRFLQKPYIYNFLSKIGRKPEDMAGVRFVLFPLQYEPESSLLYNSPELNNSMEIISWISRSLPADYFLVVKEHPVCYGMRPKRYYDYFRRMSNVILAHPGASSSEWLQSADIVSCITGSMGFEAVYLDKPVLSFGKHQLINHLPTVRYANNYETTRNGLIDLFAIADQNQLLLRSKGYLDKTLKEFSFDLKGFEKTIGSTDLHMDLAKTAFEKLGETYPEIFHLEENAVNNNACNK